MPVLILHGLSYNDFWNMTFKEILIMSKAINQQKKEKYKTDSWIAFVSANVMAQANNGKGKKYHEYFPECNDETPEMRLKREMLNRIK